MGLLAQNVLETVILSESFYRHSCSFFETKYWVGIITIFYGKRETDSSSHENYYKIW